MLLFLSFNTSARYAPILGKKNASLVMACLQNYQSLLFFVYQNSKKVPYIP